MAMDKLTIPPDQAGYSFTDAEESLRVMLDGGAPRYRRDIIGGSIGVTVQWASGPEQYTYLRRFIQEHRGKPFLIDLVIDDPALTEHIAYFRPGSTKLTGVEGFTYTLQAELDVLPGVSAQDFEASITLLQSFYGTEADDFLIDLNDFANVQMPGHL